MLLLQGMEDQHAGCPCCDTARRAVDTNKSQGRSHLARSSMMGKITLAGMAPRPRRRQAKPAKPPAEEPPAEQPGGPTFLHLDVLDHVLSYLVRAERGDDRSR